MQSCVRGEVGWSLSDKLTIGYRRRNLSRNEIRTDISLWRTQVFGDGTGGTVGDKKGWQYGEPHDVYDASSKNRRKSSVLLRQLIPGFRSQINHGICRIR